MAGKKRIRLLRIHFVNYSSPISHAINSFQSQDKFTILNMKDLPGTRGYIAGERRTQRKLRAGRELGDYSSPPSHFTAEKTKAHVFR